MSDRLRSAPSRAAGELLALTRMAAGRPAGGGRRRGRRRWAAPCGALRIGGATVLRRHGDLTSWCSGRECVTGHADLEAWGDQQRGSGRHGVRCGVVTTRRAGETVASVDPRGGLVNACGAKISARSCVEEGGARRSRQLTPCSEAVWCKGSGSCLATLGRRFLRRSARGRARYADGSDSGVRKIREGCGTTGGLTGRGRPRRRASGCPTPGRGLHIDVYRWSPYSAAKSRTASGISLVRARGVCDGAAVTALVRSARGSKVLALTTLAVAPLGRMTAGEVTRGLAPAALRAMLALTRRPIPHMPHPQRRHYQVRVHTCGGTRVVRHKTALSLPVRAARMRPSPRPPDGTTAPHLLPVPLPPPVRSPHAGHLRHHRPRRRRTRHPSRSVGLLA